MEGISGITQKEQVSKGTAAYEVTGDDVETAFMRIL